MPVRYVIQRRSQAAVVIVLERDETEGLQHAPSRIPHRTENLRHAVHRARLCLECNFNKLSMRQRTRQFEKAASDRDGLQFSFCVPAIFQTNRSQDNIAKLDPGRTPRRMRLGKVGHKLIALCHAICSADRLRKQMAGFRRRIRVFKPSKLLECGQLAYC